MGTMDLDQILSDIYVGSYPQTRADVDLLRSEGITAVLNLQTDHDFDYLGVDESSRRALYVAHGIELRRVPIRDFDDVDLQDKLYEAASTLASLTEQGHTVYVHCYGGVNRSPSAVIAFLHWFRNWSLEEATRYVQSRHPCAPVMEVVRRAVAQKPRE